MPDWRTQIIESFVPGLHPLTLVDDPDALFSEEMLIRALEEKGFTLMAYTDAVSFRYLFERDYRPAWDDGAPVNIVLIVQGDAMEGLPFDILSKGEHFSFGLDRLFPFLSASVLSHVDRAILDSLYDDELCNKKQRLGENATKDYILEHGYHIHTDMILNEASLLRLLIRFHYRGMALPSLLIERVVESFKQKGRFGDWPLKEIFSHSRIFFDFLQERWPLFLAHELEGSVKRETIEETILSYSGSPILPFGHEDIRVYMDNLFMEGYLKPVLCGESKTADKWYRCGIESSAMTDDLKRERLMERILEAIPKQDCRYSEWISFARKWAQLLALVYTGPYGTALPGSLFEKIETAFCQWIQKHYKTLINEPPNTPAMLHHLPRKLSRVLEEKQAQKIALIVLDGLSLDQWITIRGGVMHPEGRYRMDESACFAWVPTLTSVSRQTIFSGKVPWDFPSSINTTNREEKLWHQFWEAHGLKRMQIAYKRGLGDGNVKDVLDEILHPQNTKALGLVVDKVDKIMHGAQLGAPGMHNQIAQWVGTGFLDGLFQYLLELDFQIWLTSDHGNIECRGIGKPNEGAMAETRGERVRIYASETLRDTVAESYPGSRCWDPVGLPEKYYPLLFSNRDAFASKGSTLVGHGGISIQEVIVPLVKIERR